MRNPRHLVWGRDDGRVRAVWRVLVPVVVGFLTLQFANAAARGLTSDRGALLLIAFGATTLVMLAVLGLGARFLDRRPVQGYGYAFSKRWWADLGAGTVIGIGLVGVAFLLGRYTDALAVTSVGVADAATGIRLVLFLAAFVGVAFYEEYIYRGSFITNAIEGLTARGRTYSTAVAIAWLTSSAVFALIHLPGALLEDASVVLVVAKTGLLGGLLGLAYLRTGQLALPMGLHLGVNYALMNVFGLGAAGFSAIPSLVTVDGVATGLWSPVRGLPLLTATLLAYGIVLAWTCRLHGGRTPADVTSFQTRGSEL